MKFDAPNAMKREHELVRLLIAHPQWMEAYEAYESDVDFKWLAHVEKRFLSDVERVQVVFDHNRFEIVDGTICCYSYLSNSYLTWEGQVWKPRKSFKFSALKKI